MGVNSLVNSIFEDVIKLRGQNEQGWAIFQQDWSHYKQNKFGQSVRYRWGET